MAHAQAAPGLAKLKAQGIESPSWIHVPAITLYPHLTIDPQAAAQEPRDVVGMSTTAALSPDALLLAFPAPEQTPATTPAPPPAIHGVGKKDDSQANSRLVRLIAELRNTIIEPNLLEASTLTLSASGTGLLPEPPLLKTCRELRDTYLRNFNYLASINVTEIIANVHNFDFTALTTYLETLSPAQRKAITTNRSLVIKLTIDPVLKRPAWHALAAWLRYLSSCAYPADEIVTRATSAYSTDTAYRFEGELAVGSMFGIKGALNACTGAMPQGSCMGVQWLAIQCAWSYKLAYDRHRRALEMRCQYKLERRARGEEVSDSEGEEEEEEDGEEDEE